jgi:hypothetical protein
MAMTWRFPARLADPLWGPLAVTHDTQETSAPHDDRDISAGAAHPTSVSDRLANESASFEEFFRARHHAVSPTSGSMTGIGRNDSARKPSCAPDASVRRIRAFERPEGGC